MLQTASVSFSPGYSLDCHLITAICYGKGLVRAGKAATAAQHGLS